MHNSGREINFLETCIAFKHTYLFLIAFYIFSWNELTHTRTKDKVHPEIIFCKQIIGDWISSTVFALGLM